MKIYRVQTKANTGPYACSINVIKHNVYSAWSMNIRPGPREDGIEKFYNHHFGFADIDDLTCWFNRNDRRAMKKAKMSIFVYDIDEKFVKIGMKQVAFVYSKAKKIDEIDVLKLESINQ